MRDSKRRASDGRGLFTKSSTGQRQWMLIIAGVQLGSGLSLLTLETASSIDAAIGPFILWWAGLGIPGLIGFMAIFGGIAPFDGVGLRLMKAELLLQLKAIALAALLLLWGVSTAVIIAELSGGETGVGRHISDFVGAARKWHVLN